MLDCDWSSDVCSSDLTDADVRAARRVLARHAPASLLRKDRATVDDVRLVTSG
jgi:hypothetical protein